MRRAEFSKATKREALARSGGYCEAVGVVYGLSAGQRCNAPLSYGVEFDHYPIRAADGGSGDLENCLAVCVRCHRWKTHRHDAPDRAKEQRIVDRYLGVVGPGSAFPTNRRGRYRKRIDGGVVPRQRR
jgi:5-methylcytosine-specific restriction protein A